MRNLDWLCENDRDALLDLLTDTMSCDCCVYEPWVRGRTSAYCDQNCDDGQRKWLLAEHSDVLKPENGAGAEEADANDANPKADACGRISAEDFAQAMSDGMEKLNAAIESHGKTHGFYAFDEMDTREKLEADVRNHVAISITPNKPDDGVLASVGTVLGWLDRQAAITERECAERIRQLEAELNKWRKLTDGIELPDYPMAKFMPKDKDRRIAELEAKLRECDEQRIEYRDQRDWYRDRLGEFRKKLGDAVWHAQAIERMTEVD